MSESPEIDKAILDFWRRMGEVDSDKESALLCKKLTEMMAEGCITPNLCSVMLHFAIGAIGIVANGAPDRGQREQMYKDLAETLSSAHTQAQMGTLAGMAPGTRPAVDLNSGDVKNVVESEIDFVVCARKGQEAVKFDDNLEGTCHDCGSAVVFRPHSPKRPPRLCQECALERAQHGTTIN